jgi:hypothetical protein
MLQATIMFLEHVIQNATSIFNAPSFKVVSLDLSVVK